MAKMTKTQARRLLKEIHSKTMKLQNNLGVAYEVISFNEMVAMDKMVKRNLKILK